MSLKLNNDLLRLREIEAAEREFLTGDFGCALKGRDVVNPIVASLRGEKQALIELLTKAAKTGRG
jgi:hypothetical protein